MPIYAQAQIIDSSAPQIVVPVIQIYEEEEQGQGQGQNIMK